MSHPRSESSPGPRRRPKTAPRAGAVRKAKSPPRKQDRNHDLDERVKELSALHSLARLLQRADRPTAAVLEEAAALLPCAWQSPEIAACRILLDGIEVATPNFRETPWSQSAVFPLPGGRAGRIEVVSLEERPAVGIGPSLSEKQALLDSAAEMLASFVAREQAQRANLEMEAHVTERTAQLKLMNEELQTTNEELETEIAERVLAQEQLVEALSGEQAAREALESAQAELYASEARYRAIGETIPFGIWFADPEGGMTYLSQSFLNLVGMMMEECWGYGWMKRLPPEDVERTLADWKYCVETEGNWDYEYRILGADNKYRTVLCRGIPLRDASGKVVGWGGRHLDITERKRTDEEVRRLNQRLQERAQELEAANEEYEVTNEELKVANQDLATQIEVRRRTEEALRQSEVRFRSLAENIPSVLMRYNRDMRVVYLSPQAERVTGIPAEEFIGKTNREVGMPEHLCNLWETAIQEVFQSGAGRELEFGMAAADGTLRSFYLKLAPEWTRDGRTVASVLGISTDITERKNAETLNAATNAIDALIHSTLEPDEIMQRSISQAAAALDCNTAAISLREEGRWVVRYVHGFPENVIGMEMSDDEERHAVLAIETQRPVAIDDAWNDERVNREHMQKWGIRSVLVVPLLVKQAAVGALFFNYQGSPFAFRDYHIDFGARLAASLSLALENARLWGHLQEQLAEREQMVAAIGASEERYRRLVELSPDGIMVYQTGRIIFINSAGARLVGAGSPFDLIGKPILDIVHPDYHEIVRERVQAASDGKVMTPLIEEKFLRLDGEIIDVEVTGTWTEHAGEPAVQVVFRDITQRKWIESERERLLRELEMERARWKATVESMLDGVLVADAEGKVAYANPAAVQLIGWPIRPDLNPEEHPTLHQLYHPDGTPYTDRKLPLQRAALEGHAGTNEEILHRLPDGRERLVLWNAAPLRASDGRIVGSVAVGRDTTEQRRADQAILTLNKELQNRAEELEVINEELHVEVEERERAEEALRLGEERFRMAIRGSNVFLFGQDSDLRYTWAFNPSPGFTVEELVGKHDSELYPPSTAALLTRLKSSVLENGIGTRVQVPVIHPDGLHQFDMWIEPQRDAAGNLQGIIAAAIDVTERAHIQEQIEQLNQELEHRATDLESANRELEAFAYSVSHDLRMPLASIDGFARMLLEEDVGRFPPDAQRFLQLIHQNAEAMQKLIDDLLAFSRSTRQPLKKQSVAPAQIAREVLDDMQGARSGRQVEIAVSEMPACRADPALLKQVYANLLSNALKFTRAREVARIQVGCERCEGEEIPSYFVRDNGVGFNMENAERLFGVFQRFHRAEDYEGNGVGLAIVERIIHRHGGRIWAEAEVDRGATFYFTLP